MERAVPILAALVTALCSFFAIRAVGATTWWRLCGGNLSLGVFALGCLRREEILLDTVKLEPGDISRGIGAAAVGIALAVGLGTRHCRFSPSGRAKRCSSSSGCARR